jgi:hypothetical protein
MMVWTYWIQYCLPNNIVLLITIDKFDCNIVLVNINKLKPCKVIENKILQYVLVKLGNLVTNKPIQPNELVPPPVEPKKFQHVEFELINNHSTLGGIKTQEEE